MLLKYLLHFSLRSKISGTNIIDFINNQKGIDDVKEPHCSKTPKLHNNENLLRTQNLVHNNDRIISIKKLLKESRAGRTILSLFKTEKILFDKQRSMLCNLIVTDLENRLAR